MIARALKGKILVFAVFFIGIVTGMLIVNFYETRVSGSTPDQRYGRQYLEATQRALSDALVCGAPFARFSARAAIA